MNNQHQEAHIKLIQSLMSCHSYDEIRKILVANQELVDFGFLQTLEAATEMYLQQGDENTANWFRNLGSYVIQILDKIPRSPTRREEIENVVENFDVYLQFLQQILKVIYESRGNRHLIHSLFAANLDKLNLNLVKFLQIFARLNISEKENMGAKDFAEYIVKFGTLIQQFSLGDRTSNVEIAIASYEIALTVFTLQDFPERWADIQWLIGDIYYFDLSDIDNNVILEEGKIEENQEKGIICYQKALQVFTHKNFSEEWARIQKTLSNLYQERIRDKKSENIEKAIRCGLDALQVLTRESYPKNWAKIHSDLGAIYRKRIKGDRTENLEKAILCYEEAIQVYTREAFPKDWKSTQENWAITQWALCLNYFGRIQGKRLENIERAIYCGLAALKVFTRESYPENWAKIHSDLGAIYRERIKGDNTENLEQAISCLLTALEILTPESVPQYWARVQQNLGIAYSGRIKGNHSENLEQAIYHHLAALSIFTREAFPENWAAIQDNLGRTYGERIQGEKAENMEKAILYHRAALEIRTLQDFPQEFASTSGNLGIEYKDRIFGEEAENQEAAIANFKAALDVYKENQIFSESWARTQYNLGNVYSIRIRGNKAKNQEAAINSYLEALKVFTKNDFPIFWANLQNCLGIIYSSLVLGNKDENIKIAIQYLLAAQEIFTREANPLLWAKSEYNLGNVYTQRRYKNRLANLEEAIRRFLSVLEVRTREVDPQRWAMTKVALANVYIDQAFGGRTENLKSAIIHSQNAIEVYTEYAFPKNYARVQFQLGSTYYSIQQFENAYESFANAINVVQFLRDGIIAGSGLEEDKQNLAEDWSQLYQNIVKVCLKLNLPTKALEYAESSKTRNLVEQILERDSKTIFPPEVVTQLEKYRDEIAVGQYKIQNGKAENPQVIAQHLQQLRNQRNELQNQYLAVGYGFKFDSFQPTLDERTAIIEWYILNDKILAFIVTKKGELTVWQSQPEDIKALENWVNQYLQNYYKQKDQWLNNLGEELKQLALILHIDEILNQIPNHCDKLILIPHWFLHLLPLHVLPVNQDSENSRCLLDLFAGGVSYAPSLQILQQIQKRDRPNFQSLFAIQNPTEDLDFTDLEVEAILSYFPFHEVLPKKQATKAALSQAATQLNQANYLHFSCHGSFNFNSPQDSCLLLAESVDENKNLDLNKCLTLGNLFERNFDFSQTRLVVLSACETGLVDFKNTSDEYISLPSGFLYAGSRSVVSSLWTVSDLSTAFLMIKFIQNLKATMVDNEDFSVAVELQKAQNWLRNATTAELQAWANDLKLSSEQAQKNYETLGWFDADEKPFQNPVYWAAFCAIGQ
jgi:CHAT domain-containing protein